MTTPTATTVRRAWTARRTLTAVGNETVKGLRHGWGERVQILIELPLFIVFLLLLSITAGTAQAIATTGEVDWTLDAGHTTWLLLGFVGFMYAYLHTQKMFWRLLAEIQSGTLEQTYLSPLPSWVHVVAGRIVAAIAETPSSSASCWPSPACWSASTCTGASRRWFRWRCWSWAPRGWLWSSPG
jgi:ABC-2 type transport system permease protein